ncbi:hypothetical protein ACFVGM_30440 [Kitasatospora purpeofusca]|uniref:hypothetical protein n=1 Tax=Kitasatospora purpeofusca TaxID=67352 RepID=UPI003674CCF8
MALRTTTNRARRSAAVSRLTAVCALTGAALLATVTGGQAWADGGAPSAAVKTATPSASVEAGSAPAVPTAKPSAEKPEAAPAVPTAKPTPQKPEAAPVKPSVDPKAAVPTATPSAMAEGAQPKPQAPGDAKPQVREVPKGAAQAGDGSGAGDSSGLKLVGGGAVAAVGAGALGFAMLRRRSGARG